MSDSLQPHGLYVACQVPLTMGFSRQEYWSGLPCPPPGDLPKPGIESVSLCLLHWQVGSLPLAPFGSLDLWLKWPESAWSALFLMETS